MAKRSTTGTGKDGRPEEPIADPRVAASMAETSQTWDGETDPAVLIKAGNQRRVYEQHGMPWPPIAPQLVEIISLNPNSAEIGGADVLMVVSGKGLTPDVKIIFNGGEEPTTFVSEIECSTTVKPSLAGGVIEVPVIVRNTMGDSNELMFSFVEPLGRKTQAKAEDNDDEKNDQKTGKQKADQDDNEDAKGKKKGE